MKNTAIVLIVIAALLVVAASSAGSKALNKLNDLLNKRSDDGISIDTPTSTVPFGGLTLMKHVYDTDETFTTKEGYQALDSMITQLSETSSVTSSAEGVTFDLNSSETFASSFYVRFLTAEDTAGAKQVKVSDYDYFTVDFDISNVLNGSFKVYLLFRDTTGAALGANENYVTLGYNSISAGDKSVTVDNTVHVTLAYKFNAEDGYTVCNVFFNGDYATSFINPSSTPAAELDYIEGLAIGDSGILSACSFTVNNVEFNGFIKGYEGAIENMFKYPYTPLERCSDSLLFEG